MTAFDPAHLAMMYAYELMGMSLGFIGLLSSGFDDFGI